MTSHEAKRLRGAVIDRILLRPFPDGRRGWAHDPIIFLRDGRCLTFVTEEAEFDTYGTNILCVDNPPGEE